MKLIELLDVMKEKQFICVEDGKGKLLYCGRVANITFSIWHGRQIAEIEHYSDGGSMGIRIKVK